MNGGFILKSEPTEETKKGLRVFRRKRSRTNMNDFPCLLHFTAYKFLRVLVRASSEFVTYATVILSAASGEERSNTTVEGAPRSLNSESAFEYSLQRTRGTHSPLHVLNLYLSIIEDNGALVCWERPEFIAKFGSVSKGLK